MGWGGITHRSMPCSKSLSSSLLGVSNATTFLHTNNIFYYFMIGWSGLLVVTSKALSSPHLALAIISKAEIHLEARSVCLPYERVISQQVQHQKSEAHCFFLLGLMHPHQIMQQHTTYFLLVSLCVSTSCQLQFLHIASNWRVEVLGRKRGRKEVGGSPICASGNVPQIDTWRQLSQPTTFAHDWRWCRRERMRHEAFMPRRSKRW